MRKEEDDYKRGSEAQRAKIDVARNQREEFIRKEMEKEFGIGADFGASEDDDLNDDFDEENDLPPPDPDGEAELNAIREMRDKKLHKICRDHDGAFGMLFTIFQFARTDEDYALFLRVWDQVPHKHQVSFGKEFSAQTGSSIKKFIDELREQVTHNSSADSEGRGDQNEEHDGFSDDFIGARSSRKTSSKKLSPEEREGIKLLYHKLVRHLHPDLQADGRGQSHWQKKIWNRVQNANRALNKRELEKLFRLILIRSRNLNDLTLSEIKDSQAWLKEELDELSREARDLKKLPAWGFSRLKDYSGLKRKLEKPFEIELRQIQEMINELREQHSFLEMMGRASPARRPYKARKRRRPKTRAPTQQTRRPSDEVHGQTSFFG